MPGHRAENHLVFLQYDIKYQFNYHPMFVFASMTTERKKSIQSTMTLMPTTHYRKISFSSEETLSSHIFHLERLKKCLRIVSMMRHQSQGLFIGCQKISFTNFSRLSFQLKDLCLANFIYRSKQFLKCRDENLYH